MASSITIINKILPRLIFSRATLFRFSICEIAINCKFTNWFCLFVRKWFMKLIWLTNITFFSKLIMNVHVTRNVWTTIYFQRKCFRNVRPSTWTFVSILRLWHCSIAENHTGIHENSLAFHSPHLTPSLFIHIYCVKCYQDKSTQVIRALHSILHSSTLSSSLWNKIDVSLSEVSKENFFFCLKQFY